MQQTHTPGPWVTAVVGPQVQVRSGGKHGPHVTTLSVEQFADARLIAAAPAMRAALADAERWLVYLTGQHDDPRAVQLREVLAVAEGRS